MADDTKTKARAARALVDAMCDLLTACGSEDGERLGRAIDAVDATVGEEGFKELKRGDLVGCGIEALRNHRRRRRSG